MDWNGSRAGFNLVGLVLFYVFIERNRQQQTQ
jgi:hypothetical protein